MALKKRCTTTQVKPLFEQKFQKLQDSKITEEVSSGLAAMKGKLPGNHIINETSKRVGLRPQKETTPEYLAFHRFKQKT